MDFLPRIALTVKEDADLLHDVLNAALVREEDTNRRAHLTDLLIAVHGETIRFRMIATEEGTS